MPGMSKAGRTERSGCDAGYTYPAVLILLVAVGLALQTASIPSADEVIRDREAELLFRGTAYRDAIVSYQAANGSLPARLQDLVSDPNSEGVRYIRRLYEDPMPGGGWRIVQQAGGGIIGVASSAAGAPRREAFFPDGLEDFEDAETYADWRFTVESGNR